MLRMVPLPCKCRGGIQYEPLSLAAFRGRRLALRFPGPPQILSDRRAGEMRVDGFMPLALEGRDDVGKIVAGAGACELEGALDGRSAGR